MLEFGEHLLDRVEIWTVGRQEEDLCAGRADRGSNSLPLVAAEIVEDDDVAGGQCRDQDTFDIEAEALAVDGAVDDPRSIDPIMTKRGDEGHGMPMTEGRSGPAPGASAAPAPEWSHVGLQPSLVDEHETAWIKLPLVGFPPYPPSGDVRTILFDGQQRFF